MGIFRCRPNLSNAPEIRSVFFFSIVKLHDFHYTKLPDLLSITHATLFHPLLRLDLGPGPLWYFPRDPRKTY